MEETETLEVGQESSVNEQYAKQLEEVEKMTEEPTKTEEQKLLEQYSDKLAFLINKNKELRKTIDSLKSANQSLALHGSVEAAVAEKSFDDIILENFGGM